MSTERWQIICSLFIELQSKFSSVTHTQKKFTSQSVSHKSLLNTKRTENPNTIRTLRLPRRLVTELNCTRTHCRLKKNKPKKYKRSAHRKRRTVRQTEEQNAGAEKMSGLKISAQLSTFSSTYTTPALHMLLIHFPTFHSPLLLFLFLHHHHQLMITNVHRVCLLSSAVKAKRLRCSNAAAAASAVQVEVCLSLPPECLSTQEMLK